MRDITSIRALAAVTAMAAAVFAPQPASAEVTLTSVMSLPSNLELAQSFLVNFKDAVNKSGKNIVQINHLGGPEVVPPNKGADAVRRGQFDLLHGPTSYYIGLVPEGYGLTLSTKTPTELRENGGWAILEKAYAERANVKLLAWGEPGTQYNTYLTKEPEFTDDGKLTLENFKMRVTGTYRPLFTSLGATAIGMKASEIYTGLGRGVVQGFGWPDVGIVALGLHKLVKYRIDPPFYRSNNTVIMNLDKWRELPKEARDLLQAEAIAYEQRAIEYMGVRQKRDEKAVLDAGAKIVELEGEAADHYLDAANTAVWERLAEQSKYAREIQRTSFPEWTPPQTN